MYKGIFRDVLVFMISESRKSFEGKVKEKGLQI
jgi:hypothetical protein